MPADPIPAEPTSAQHAANAEHIRQAAHELIDLGLSFARMLHSQAEATEPASDLSSSDLPALAAAFDKISRTVRLAILLARKLAEPLPAARPPLDRTAARKRIIREVEDAIDLGRRTDGVDVEALEAELLDRLDRPDLEADLATRPLELIIADLARDLGVGHPLDQKFFRWKRRTPEDIEILEAHAAEPLPTDPRPPRTATRAPPPPEIQLPDDPAEAVAMVLAMGRARDG